MTEITLEEEIEYLKEVAQERYKWAWELQQENLKLKRNLSLIWHFAERALDDDYPTDKAFEDIMKKATEHNYYLSITLVSKRSEGEE